MKLLMVADAGTPQAKDFASKYAVKFGADPMVSAGTVWLMMLQNRTVY
jgi:hypothetical protein